MTGNGTLKVSAPRKQSGTQRLRLDNALLEMAENFRGTLLHPETADKITRRILDGKGQRQ